MSARTFLLTAFVSLFSLSVDPVTASDYLKISPEHGGIYNSIVQTAHFEYSRAMTSGSIHAYERAEAVLRKAERKVRQSAVLPYYLGQTYLKLRDAKSAKKAFERALKGREDFSEAHVGLGEAEYLSSEFELALAHAEHALGLEVTHTAQVLKLRSLIALARFGDASNFIDEIKASQPTENLVTFEFLRRRLQHVINGPNWDNVWIQEEKHYRIRTNVSENFAQGAARHAGLILRLYRSSFPKIKTPQRKYEILIHANRFDYLNAGGPHGSYGYYDPLFRQLHLYHIADEAEVLQTLYHECFHQFLHQYTEHAPIWFNEGVAEYFSPTLYTQRNGKERMRILPSQGRLTDAKALIDLNQQVSLRRLMLLSQSEFYERTKVDFFYAQAWSIVYFCLEGENKKYRWTISQYFNEIHKGTSQSDAYEKTFAKLPLDVFENEWKVFILGL